MKYSFTFSKREQIASFHLLIELTLITGSNLTHYAIMYFFWKANNLNVISNIFSLKNFSNLGVFKARRERKNLKHSSFLLDRWWCPLFLFVSSLTSFYSLCFFSLHFFYKHCTHSLRGAEEQAMKILFSKLNKNHFYPVCFFVPTFCECHLMIIYWWPFVTDFSFSPLFFTSSFFFILFSNTRSFSPLLSFSLSLRKFSLPCHQFNNNIFKKSFV